MEVLGAIIMLGIVTAVFSGIYSTTIEEAYGFNIEHPHPIISCEFNNETITLFHKGGPVVNCWSLFVNNTLIKEGCNFALGDTITFGAAIAPNCSISLLDGNDNLLFYCEL